MLTSFSHATGLGTIKEHRGHYWDALYKKKVVVIPMIVETFGGISPHSINYISRLSKRTKGARACDRTVYGFSRTSTRSYFVHHTQQLAAAAQVGDAKAMRRKLIHEKMHIMQRSSVAGGRA